ncbi:class I SAM-dependent methyltransferase [Hassallia byssoidea VB512170]|uniref:Class I SAM-dependent methyltransferase n=1 Tax=Hassallia byssoidea VB512170 TaxID=1304833 RepID=A0A846HI73_9CYAN|nr:class I SAM-dependent methyltransferase [Hassalia byssoidea]NEU76753.1 class I SAM-dependent methyltransferase [Hassalia byssoidea VB512170]
MQNKNLWTETKFIKTAQGYKASNDPKNVSLSSHIIANIQASIYEKIIRQHATGLLLDLGCGNVPLYGIYKDLVQDNICIDWGNTLHKNQYLDYEFDLNNVLSLESEQFDTILSTDVLEHIAKPELLMSEMARLLKPDGKIILTVPFLYWLHEQPYDFFRYTEFALRMFCKNNNLTLIELEPYGGALEVVLDIIAKQMIQFSPVLCKIYSKLAIIFFESHLGKQISRKTAKKFPIGYYLVAQKPVDNLIEQKV